MIFNENLDILKYTFPKLGLNTPDVQNYNSQKMMNFNEKSQKMTYFDTF